MAVRLCLSGVGEVSPTRLLKRMTADDISLFQAYYATCPFGSEPLHLLIAQLTSLIYNQRRRETSPASEPKDWLPWHLPPEQTADEIFATLRSVTRGGSGKP